MSHDPAAEGATVLNVNDDEAGRYAITRTLSRAGLRVEEAGTGAEALRRVRDGADLVILDVDLPDVSGLDVCRQLKADPELAAIPVLQISAKFVSSEDRVQGLEGGADGYLTQPFEPAELVATVHSLLRLRRAERAAAASARQWEVTFEAIRDGVCLTDAAGHVVRCNRAFCRTLGIDPARAVGARLPDLLHDWAGAVPEGGGTEWCVGGRYFHFRSDPVTGGGGSAGAVHTLAEWTDRKRVEELEQELAALERVARAPLLSLRQSAPDAFAEIAAGYAEVLELALEQRQYKVTHDLSGRLGLLGDRLAALRASPRDVIAVHNFALHSRRPGAAPARLQAYVEEGRLLLLELMGDLVTQYRRHAPPGPAPAPSSAIHEGATRE